MDTAIKDDYKSTDYKYHLMRNKGGGIKPKCYMQ